MRLHTPKPNAIGQIGLGVELVQINSKQSGTILQTNLDKIETHLKVSPN